MALPSLCSVHVVQIILLAGHTLPWFRINEFSITSDYLILPVVVFRICIDTQWMLFATPILALFYSDVSNTTSALYLVLDHILLIYLIV